MKIVCWKLIAWNVLLDADCWKLIAGNWLLEIDCWKLMLEIDCWKWIAGNLLLAFNCWKFIAGNLLLTPADTLLTLTDTFLRTKSLRTEFIRTEFLAALSSSRSLVVCPSGGRSVGWSVGLSCLWKSDL